MSEIFENTLAKINRESSVWVPPITYTGVREYVQEVPGAKYKKFVRRERRAALPAGWKADFLYALVPSSNGGITYSRSFGHFVITPGSRMVNGLLEVWSKEADGRTGWTVDLYRYESGSVATTIVREPFTEVIVPGYWESQEAPPSWSAGARSAAEGYAPWQLTFRVPHTPQGAVIGISESGDAQDMRERIRHGFYVRGDDVFLWNPGSKAVVGFQAIPPRQDATVFRLSSANGVVSFYMDGLLLAQTPDLTSPALVFMAAALYGATDLITQPTFTFGAPTAEGAITLSMLLRGGRVLNGGSIALHLSMKGSNAVNHIRIPSGMRVRASDRQSVGVVTLRRRLKVFGYGRKGQTGTGTVTLGLKATGHAYSAGFGLVRLHPFAELLLGTAGKGALDVTCILHGRIEGVVTEGEIVFQQVSVQDSVTVDVRTNQTVSGRLLTKSPITVSRVLPAEVKGALAVSEVIGAQKIIGAAVVEVVHMGCTMHYGIVFDLTVGMGLHTLDEVSAGRDLSALVSEVMEMSADLVPEATMHVHIGTIVGVTESQGYGAPSQVWSVTNSGDASGSSTSYTDYPFNSFANIGGEYFGAAADGLYVLEGCSNDGRPIEAKMDFGLRDFGTNAIKGLEKAYISTNAQAPMKLTVSMLGDSYEYDARSADPHMRTQRFDLGRGLKANKFGLKLANQEGAAFETGGLEFIVNESNRRI